MTITCINEGFAAISCRLSRVVFLVIMITSAIKLRRSSSCRLARLSNSYGGTKKLFSDQQRRRENSRFREVPKSQKPKAGQSTDGVSYRYRSGTKESLSSLWGQGSDGQEEEESKTKGYVPFFKEVDAYMEKKRAMKERKSSLESIFDSIDSSLSSKGDDETTATSISSILSSIPAKDASSSSRGVFDEESYTEYRAMMDEMVESDRFHRRHTSKPLSDEFSEPVIDWLLRDDRVVDYHLPTLDAAVREGPNRALAKPLRQELLNQNASFVEATGLNEKQVEKARVALTVLGMRCASRAKASPLDVAWEKVKEAGLLLEEESLNNFLHACTTYSTRSRRTLSSPMGSILDILDPSSSLKTEDAATEEPTTTKPHSHEGEGSDEGGPDVPKEIATVHDVLYEPTSASLTVRVKALVAQGDALTAEAIVLKVRTQTILCGCVLANDHDTQSGNEELQLRTFLPIYRLHLENGDLPSALSLFKRMRDTPSVILDPESYVQLIAGIAEQGYFK